MNWDPQVLLWGFKRQFTHESGHALMCYLRQTYCHGIAYDKADPRFCTLRKMPEQRSVLTESDRLIFAAGVAAEQVSPCPQTPDWEDGTDNDKKYFANEHSFYEAVKSATEILIGRKPIIEAVCSRLIKKAKEFNGRVECLPECKANDHDYAILLTAHELIDVIRAADSRDESGGQAGE